MHNYWFIGLETLAMYWSIWRRAGGKSCSQNIWYFIDIHACARTHTYTQATLRTLDGTTGVEGKCEKNCTILELMTLCVEIQRTKFKWLCSQWMATVGTIEMSIISVACLEQQFPNVVHKSIEFKRNISGDCLKLCSSFTWRRIKREALKWTCDVYFPLVHTVLRCFCVLWSLV
jgi:hypothetical protein